VFTQECGAGRAKPSRGVPEEGHSHSHRRNEGTRHAAWAAAPGEEASWSPDRQRMLRNEAATHATQGRSELLSLLYGGNDGEGEGKGQADAKTHTNDSHRSLVKRDKCTVDAPSHVRRPLNFRLTDGQRNAPEAAVALAACAPPHVRKEPWATRAHEQQHLDARGRRDLTSRSSHCAWDAVSGCDSTGDAPSEGLSRHEHQYEHHHLQAGFDKLTPLQRERIMHRESEMRSKRPAAHAQTQAQAQARAQAQAQGGLRGDVVPVHEYEDITAKAFRAKSAWSRPKDVAADMTESLEAFIKVVCLLASAPLPAPPAPCISPECAHYCEIFR
jgi:hypothetical protein